LIDIDSDIDIVQKSSRSLSEIENLTEISRNSVRRIQTRIAASSVSTQEGAPAFWFSSPASAAERYCL